MLHPYRTLTTTAQSPAVQTLMTLDKFSCRTHSVFVHLLPIQVATAQPRSDHRPMPCAAEYHLADKRHLYQRRCRATTAQRRFAHIVLPCATGSSHWCLVNSHPRHI